MKSKSHSYKTFIVILCLVILVIELISFVTKSNTQFYSSFTAIIFFFLIVNSRIFMNRKSNVDNFLLIFYIIFLLFSIYYELYNYKGDYISIFLSIYVSFLGIIVWCLRGFFATKALKIKYINLKYTYYFQFYLVVGYNLFFNTYNLIYGFKWVTQCNTFLLPAFIIMIICQFVAILQIKSETLLQDIQNS